jgi:hypothetical protein
MQCLGYLSIVACFEGYKIKTFILPIWKLIERWEGGHFAPLGETPPSRALRGRMEGKSCKLSLTFQMQQIGITKNSFDFKELFEHKSLS